MQYAWPVWPCQLELVQLHRTVGTEFGNPDSSLIMPDFDLIGDLSLKIELHMLRPITEKVHSGNGPVSLVHTARRDRKWPISLLLPFSEIYGAPRLLKIGEIRENSKTQKITNLQNGFWNLERRKIMSVLKIITGHYFWKLIYAS